jgi:hypothetical protein
MEFLPQALKSDRSDLIDIAPDSTWQIKKDGIVFCQCPFIFG